MAMVLPQPGGPASRRFLRCGPSTRLHLSPRRPEGGYAAPDRLPQAAIPRHNPDLGHQCRTLSYGPCPPTGPRVRPPSAGYLPGASDFRQSVNSCNTSCRPQRSR
jgi:hypothetical protein